MDFKKTSHIKIVPKIEQKNSQMADIMGMAQGGMAFLPMLPTKMKLFIGLALFFLAFGVISFVVCTIKLFIVYPLITGISLAVLFVLGYFILTRKKKK